MNAVTAIGDGMLDRIRSMIAGNKQIPLERPDMLVHIQRPSAVAMQYASSDADCLQRGAAICWGGPRSPHQSRATAMAATETYSLRS